MPANKRHLLSNRLVDLLGPWIDMERQPDLGFFAELGSLVAMWLFKILAKLG